MLALKNQSDERLSQLVVTWVLMIPLFFFACRGILWFQATAGNSAAGTGFGSITTAKGGGEVAVLGTVFFCVLLLLMTRLVSVWEMCWTNRLFLVLSLYALVSCLWSQFPRRTWQFGIYIVLDLLFVFYLHSRFRPQEVMQLFRMTGWIVVLGSILFALALPKYGVDHRASTSGAWQGVFVYKNTCSVMVTFLLSVAFYIPVRTLRDRFLRIAYILSSIFVVIMTRARTGWLVLAALLAYVVVIKLIYSFRARDRRFVCALLALVFSVVAAAGALYYRPILLAMGKDATLTGRTDIWKLVVLSAMKSPFLGYGYRAFWSGLQGESAFIVLMQKWTVPGAHNGLLETWLDLGLIGVGMVLATLAVALRDAVRCLRQGVSPTVLWYISILLMTVVTNCAEMTLMYPNYLSWIMYVFACVGLAREAKQRYSLNRVGEARHA